MRRSIVVCVLLALTSCHDVQDTTTHPITHTIDQQVIAGSSFLVHSRQFRFEPAPAITLDTFKLEYTHAADTTLIVRVPQKARGAMHLTVNGRELATVDVLGFVSFRPRTTSLLGNPRRFPANGPVSLVAGAPDYRVVQFIPSTGEVRDLLSGYRLDNSEARSIGPTHNQSVFLLQSVDSLQPAGINRAVEAWDLNGIPTRTAVYPDLRNSRVLAQLGDSIFVHGLAHQVVSVRMHRGGVYSGTYSETNDIALSPRKDRAAVQVHFTLGLGLPVLSMLTGDTVYHVRSIRGSEGVAFSPNGDTLFVLGFVNHDRDARFLVLDAATGHELDRFELPWSYLMAIDHENAIAYFAVIQEVVGGVVRVLALDYRSMQIIGEMSTGSLTQDDFACSYRSLSVGTDGVFLVCGGSTWRFDRIPARRQ